MSSKDAFWEDLDTQKVISPFLKKSHHQVYLLGLKELSPLPAKAGLFFLKHEKRWGLSVIPAMDDDFIQTLQGRLKSPIIICPLQDQDVTWNCNILVGKN